jgi:hypothetical protein
MDMTTPLLQTGVLALTMTMLTGLSLPAERTTDLPVESPEESVNKQYCAIDNSAFQPGEELTYKMYYNWKFVWVSAGEVTFKVDETPNGQYHISAIGSTYRSYDSFFKVRDKYHSWLDKETLLPSVSLRDVEEGPYRLYDKVTFDRNEQVAKSLRGKSKDVAKTKEYQVEQCIHDILSIIYFTRNLDFGQMKEGEAFPIKIFIDKKTWPLQVVYKGKEEKKRVRGQGKFDTMIFSPEVIAGNVFNEGAEVNVWVSDDKNRIPLQVESPLTVGTVKAVLKDYKGLKHELTSAY